MSEKGCSGTVINISVLKGGGTATAYGGSQDREANRSYSCQPTPEPQPHGIRAMSVTYTTAHDNAGSLTHWARPGIEPMSSWILVGFVTAEPWWKLLVILFLIV